MFLKILLANHLHVMALDFLWKLLVAQSYRDGAMTTSRPCGYTLLIQCVILCTKQTPPRADEKVHILCSACETRTSLDKKRKPGHQ